MPPAVAPAVEMTAEDLKGLINKQAKKALREGEKKGKEKAVREIKKSAANAPDPASRPGGSIAVPNVNLNRPVRLSLAKAIRAIADPSGQTWGREAVLERDFSQAAQGLLLNDAEQGSFVYPSTAGAIAQVVAQAAIPFEGHKAVREWATRAAGEATTGAGGALVPPEFLQNEFVLSLQTAVAFPNLPGVRRVPVNSNLIYFPRETVMPASAAYAEAATISPTDATFGQQAITIKKQAAYNQFSNELLADSTPEYEAFIGRSLARSLALRQDYEYFEGDGSGAHVLGLHSYPGQTTGYTVGGHGNDWSQSAKGATAPGTDNVLSMIAAARTAGWEPNFMVMHPDVLDLGLAKVKDANGRYILESAGGVFGAPVALPAVGTLPTQITYQTPPWKAMVLGIPVFLTAQIPVNETGGASGATGGTTTHVFMGDGNYAAILERQAIELARADQILFTTDQTAVRVTARSAIVLLAPGAFMTQLGVKPV